MKASGQNPLRQALAKSQQAEPHPDPDLLTAFAEGALIAREREEISGHLAVCGECREVLSRASGAAVDPVEVKPQLLPRPMHPPLRRWLPWVAVAAGIVVCSAVLLRHQSKSVVAPPTQVAVVSQQEAKALPQAPTPQFEVAPAPKPRHTKPAHGSAEQPIIAPEAVPNSSVIASAPAVVGKMTIPLPTYQAGPSQSASAPAIAGGTHLNGQAYVSGRRATAFAGSARAPTAYGALSLRTARPQWRINESGQVERSFGGGVWQPMLPEEKSKMRVVSVFDGDVWIGGDDSRLYHSSDNGTTWNAIALPDKDGGGHSIAHIRFETPEAGTVSAEDGTSWTTTDGGKTWN